MHLTYVFVENCPDFEILAHVIRRGLQGFINGESPDANDLRPRLYGEKL